MIRAWKILLCGALTTCVLAESPQHDNGETVYRFYCYQCHGYSGDAKTLASTYLSPRPRNFAATSTAELEREQMIEAVTRGRSGTAMVAFAGVLSTDEIEAVVDYIRATFMGPTKPDLRYHTAANGWPEHDRYAPAFPFVFGTLPLDQSWETLTTEQRRGKQLYLNACVSCHDHASGRDQGPVWELRALSYPRRHYSHRMKVDSLTGASPYALHDQAPQHESLSPLEKRGEALYQANCAFCHAADGTSRNWIGSFLQPRPRDLTRLADSSEFDAWLRNAIRNGVPGTSMPAWRHVLAERDIDAIIAYLRRVFGRQTPPPA